jgi:hypothetical protein
LSAKRIEGSSLLWDDARVEVEGEAGRGQPVAAGDGSVETLLGESRWPPAVFLDYLHLGFTNATAFSPTDVVPLTRRAKYAMLLQSTVALALFGLVVARAVNAFK